MTVRHRLGAYDILFTSLAEAIRNIPVDSVCITDQNVAKAYGARWADRPLFCVPPGESSKSVSEWASLSSALANANVARSTAITAFGGGVVGDLAGFVAATYMRGVPLIQVPTTLLAQVDSSVGGKVAIDLPEGKNLLGAFYPPEAVYICDEVLDTLPEREFRSGMAEVWKYGFILDSSLVHDLSAGTWERQHIVRRCIDLKRQVVEADEFETSGERAKLNFGHTVGHAIEMVTGYGPVLHGEAVAIGMVAEAALGEAMGLSSPGTRRIVEDCLRSQGLPTTSIVLRTTDVLIDAMRRDKKARAGKLAFALLRSIGDCTLVEDVSEEAVRAVLADL